MDVQAAFFSTALRSEFSIPQTRTSIHRPSRTPPSAEPRLPKTAADYSATEKAIDCLSPALSSAADPRLPKTAADYSATGLAMDCLSPAPTSTRMPRLPKPQQITAPPKPAAENPGDPEFLETVCRIGVKKRRYPAPVSFCPPSLFVIVLMTIIVSCSQCLHYPPTRLTGLIGITGGTVS